MGAGYHTIHHTLYNYNYGHYFTFVDRCGGAVLHCSAVCRGALLGTAPAPHVPQQEDEQRAPKPRCLVCMHVPVFLRAWRRLFGTLISPEENEERRAATRKAAAEKGQ